MLKRMRRIGLFVLAIAVVISSAIIASANERSSNTGSATVQSTASSYVIENKSRNDIKVTIEHYNKDTNKAIYSTDEKTLAYGAKINDYAKALNWTVDYATVNGTKVTSSNYLELTKDSTVKVYYKAKSATVDGPTTFYDYTIASNDGYTKYESWDQWNQYGQWIQQYQSFNSLGDAVGINGKLTSGTKNNNWANNYQYSYDCNVTENNGTITNANVWTGTDRSVTGIISGLNADGSVRFNYPEPGFFVNEDATYKAASDGSTRYLRKVYNDKKLQFSKTGDSYSLTQVNDADGNKLTNSGTDFYPLENYKDKYESADAAHNYFFGMRYDVTFKLGDYIGPLDYSFTGDDDLWVILDGNKVVIDLGGIHNTAKGTTNLWDDLGLTPGKLTEDQKNQTHTLTILYMERGANISNCTMNFTLPSARISEVTNVPMADLTFNKINSKGEGLSGASFKLVNDNDSSEVYTASSYGNDGTVKFDKLKVGTYTLTETMAPNGYMTSTDTWKVKVIEENGTAVTRLYNADGTVEVTDYKIKNTSNDEYLNSSLEVNKTAKVTDWDARKYEITLSASSYAQKEIPADPVDVVLVFDTSGSMKFRSSLQKYKNCTVSQLSGSGPYYYVIGNSSATVYRIQKNGKKWYYQDDSYSGLGTEITSNSNIIKKGENYQFYTTNDDHDRLYYLKQAATTFTTDLAAKSPNSKVSLVTFNAKATQQFGLKNIGKNLSSINNTINNLTTDGGTRQDLGLEKAIEIAQGSNRNKYVILLTDGCPNAKGNDYVMSYQAMIDKANALKAMDNTTLMTVGVGLNSENSALVGAKDKLKKIASENGNSKYAYTVEANYLSEVFNSILGSITSDASITGATVKDYIDSRFIILDDNGEEMTKDYPNIENGVQLSNGGKVYYDGDRQYIVWKDQGIGPKNKTNNTPGWKRTITVKAQEDYIGGNDVTTNGVDSGITVGDNPVYFPQPKVNVKAELPITNKKITIYKGDSIPSDEEILRDLLGSKYLNKYGIDLKSFTIERSTSSNFDSLVEIFEGLKPEQDTRYYVRVSYNAGEPSKESNKNTTLDDNVYHAGDDNNIVYAKNNGNVHEGDKITNDDKLKDQQYGVYDVDVKSGTLKIVKKVDVATNKDRTFTFNVNGSDGSKQTIEVKVPKNETEGTMSLSNLSRGTYTIEEIVPTGFEVSNIKFVDKDTDSLNGINGTIATITFGTDKTDNGVTDNNVIDNYQYKGNGIKGKLEITNRTVITNWKIVKVRKDDNKTIISGAKFALKQNGKVKYTGESDENGYIIWSKGSENNVTLASGEYILEETEAAEGYAKGDTTWTLKVTDGGNLEYIKDADGKVISPSVVEEVNLYKFTNDVPYELPETGGIGIYWYTVGGMLLMVMAAIVVYRKRYNGYMNK